jgi:cold shock CspA family protein
MVEAFDEHVGLGTVVDLDGARHPFHCTAILDGTRNIETGAAVTYQLVPGRSGNFEAAMLAPRVPG